ncbi:uncharacterized protein SPPG_07888 [Spizellomyces punctatus DAOM BR117]|uniref:Ubiquitin-like protease family profile domain-containing protein n=1 Tax=Spizellomyces punctatus (strain DAOM BR117) TaxID=645134 RepID=A0A0L0H731_SPIPD|nr:uncharacterized protein SPPG_07888 [Spizellomyces punctatus DAOM BR117]KNC96676.1 hypothetical protein SPPG_07888 [Spizellomyces punctatus DAOM BR117]|eukprot:XP_016604716.1 hypothetical protein SPPG_07888 [Spizellomyces punctatus DAOM BR117]
MGAKRSRDSDVDGDVLPPSKFSIRSWCTFGGTRGEKSFSRGADSSSRSWTFGLLGGGDHVGCLWSAVRREKYTFSPVKTPSSLDAVCSLATAPNVFAETGKAPDGRDTVESRLWSAVRSQRKARHAAAHLKLIKSTMPQHYARIIGATIKPDTCENGSRNFAKRIRVRNGSQGPRVGKDRMLKALTERAKEALRLSGILLETKPETPVYADLVSKRNQIERDLQEFKDFAEDEWDEAFPRRTKPFAALSVEQEMQIESALAPGPGTAVVVSGFNVDMTKTDIRTLLDGNWLNDEVINFYGQLIMTRAKEDLARYPKLHCFNTFFYKYLTQNYGLVRKWTRKFDIFALDYVIMPVHLGNHWTCAVINFKRKRLEYYDSLHGGHSSIFKNLRHYLEQESKDKKKTTVDLSEWTEHVPKNVPVQLNGNDCGVFTCLFMEYTARERAFDFDGTHMPYFRKRIMCEILRKRLMID